MQTFFRITSLYDLVECLELLMVTNASNSLNILVDMKWTWDLGMKKTFILLDTISIVFFLKDCYWWLVVTLAENNIQKKRLCVKKMTGCLMKIIWKCYIFIVIKAVGLFLYIWYFRKGLKGLLQNTYWILELLYKINPLLRLL